jgi:hypothetical protein
MEAFKGFPNEELICSTPLMSNSFIEQNNNCSFELKEKLVDEFQEYQANSIVRKKNNLILYKDLVIDLESKKIDQNRKIDSREVEVEEVAKLAMKMKKSENYLNQSNNVSFTREDKDVDLSKSFVEKFFARELTSKNNSNGSSLGEHDDTLTEKSNGNEIFNNNK